MVLGVTLQLRTRHVRGGHSSPPSLGHGSTCAPTERRESQESTVGDVCGTLWAQRQVQGATPSTLRAATLQLPGLGQLKSAPTGQFGPWMVALRLEANDMGVLKKVHSTLPWTACRAAERLGEIVPWGHSSAPNESRAVFGRSGNDSGRCLWHSLSRGRLTERIQAGSSGATLQLWPSLYHLSFSNNYQTPPSPAAMKPFGIYRAT